MIPTPIYSGAIAAEQQVSNEELACWEKEKHSHVMMEHLAVLKRAAEIRANTDLMKQLRAFIREQRDELSVLLDNV